MMGLNKFGSRVDLLLPVGTKIYQIDTKQNWVVITAIDATGGTETITTKLASLQEIVPITIGTNTNAKLTIRTSGNTELLTPGSQKIDLLPAEASVADGSGKAGLISGDDQRKLNGLSTGVGVYTSNYFESDGSQILPALSPLPKSTSTSSSVVVSYNGVELNPANGQYTINMTTGVITFVVAKLVVSQYDIITVTYIK